MTHRQSLGHIQHARSGDAPAYHVGSSERTAGIRRGLQEHYEEHCYVSPGSALPGTHPAPHELSEQAQQSRMIAALPQHQHALVRAAGMRLRVVLVTLRIWLARSAQRDEQLA